MLPPRQCTSLILTARVHCFCLQNSVQQFASLVYVSGTAGAALLQRSSLTLTACQISDNTADHDAGALLTQQPTRLAVTDSIIEANRALDGVGGGLVVRGTGKAAAVDLQGCVFRGNVAGAGSGGGVVLDSGLGVLEVACEGCQFDGNIAGQVRGCWQHACQPAFTSRSLSLLLAVPTTWCDRCLSAVQSVLCLLMTGPSNPDVLCCLQDGGGVAATGPTLFGCTHCHATNNTASHSGGWFYCGGCSSTTITAGSSSSNRAAAAGGAVSCVGCGDFTSQDCNYSTNAAGAGGAVAVQSAATVRVLSTIFDQNNATVDAATHSTAAAGSSKQLQLMNQLPPTWQLLYGVGTAASGSVSCSSGGSGGGLCVGGAAEAQLVDLSLTNNIGGTGGAVFASAACSGTDAVSPGSSSSSSTCSLDLVNMSARGNVAHEAGGALYSSTPQAINITSAAGEGVTSQALQQLASGNTVSRGGYGPGAASFPFGLSLMEPAGSDSADALDVQLHSDDSTVAGEQQQQQQHAEDLMGSHGRRLHQIVSHAGSGSGNSLKDTLLDLSRNVVNKVSSAEDASLNAGGRGQEAVVAYLTSSQQ